ncbi:MAG: ABC transporter permease subunit [Bdellovibrionales bacterium]|nr:ABC transporter permease subunit [Bdellovibrionales bacterium]
MTVHVHDLKILFRARPRSMFLRLSAWFFVLLVLLSWPLGGFTSGSFFTARRLQNVERFAGELVPYALRGSDITLEGVLGWASELWIRRGAEALFSTLAISLVAALVMGMLTWVLAPIAARTLASASALLPTASRNAVSMLGVLGFLTRLLFLFLRAIPEYVWAYVFLGLLGPSAWPAVLALAVHNTGVLGKLTADTIENLPQAPLTALRGLGATRAQTAIAGVFPLSLPRYLLYFFFRWEHCIRESTVLGMLGIVSLGYWLQDARARTFYDEMFFYVVLGALLVLIGDLLSAIARSILRRTS